MKSWDSNQEGLTTTIMIGNQTKVFSQLAQGVVSRMEHKQTRGMGVATGAVATMASSSANHQRLRNISNSLMGCFRNRLL
jgi:hypothetical protein